MTTLTTLTTPRGGAVAGRVDRSLDRWDLSTRVQDERFHDLFTLQPGRIVELSGEPGSGLTRLGFRMLVEPSLRSSVVVVDVRGWMSPEAAWEVGVERRHLVVVRSPEAGRWLQVMAVLCEGVRAIVAEVPSGIRPHDTRRLAALVRARQVRLALRPVADPLPTGVAHMRLRACSTVWEGADRGHGRLRDRRLVIEASGRGMGGMSRRVEVEESDAVDVRVVSGLVVGQTGRAG